jgi:hypothetical protein
MMQVPKEFRRRLVEGKVGVLFFYFKDLKCKIHEKTTRRTPALLSQCHFILQNQ